MYADLKDAGANPPEVFNLGNKEPVYVPKPFAKGATI